MVAQLVRDQHVHHVYSTATHLPFTLRSMTKERDVASSPLWFCGVIRKYRWCR
jgi:hypothetical protein